MKTCLSRGKILVNAATNLEAGHMAESKTVSTAGN